MFKNKKKKYGNGPKIGRNPFIEPFPKILKNFTGADVTSYQVLITKHRVMKFIELYFSLNGP